MYCFALQALTVAVPDDRNLKIDCKDRKLGFQFDPLHVEYDQLMGKEMIVTLDKITDVEGNSIGDKIVFNKTIANLNLDEVSTSFDFKLKTQSCVAPIDESNIRNKIAAELALSDAGRVVILSASCSGVETVANVKIHPTPGVPQRRLRSGDGEHTALSAFYYLIDVASDGAKLGERKLISLDDTTPVVFSVSNLAIHPGESDVKEYELDGELTPEEEIIMAMAEGCDSHNLQQRQQMLKMEMSMKKQMEELEKHLDDKLDHIFEGDSKGLADTIPSPSYIPTEKSLPDKSELVDLLKQMRLEQEQQQMRLEQRIEMEKHEARFLNICFGAITSVAIAVSLYTRGGSQRASCSS